MSRVVDVFLLTDFPSHEKTQTPFGRNDYQLTDCESQFSAAPERVFVALRQFDMGIDFFSITICVTVFFFHLAPPSN